MSENGNDTPTTGAAPAAPSPAPAPARDVATIKGELLDVTNQLLDNDDWTKREGLCERRGKLYGELEALERKAKPLFDEKKLAAAERGETPQEGNEQPTDMQPGDDKPYQIDIPKELTASQTEIATELAGDIGVLAKSAGISADVASDIFAFAVDAEINGPGIDGSNADASMGVLHHRYGEEATKKIVADAQAAVRRLGPQVKQWLEVADPASGAALGNLPSVLVALAEFHRGSFGVPADKAAAAIELLRQSPDYQKGHPQAVDRMKALQRVVSRAQDKARAAQDKQAPVRKAAPVSPSASSKTEARIKELRTHPAYLDKSHASHKEIVAQVSALYGSLNPEKK